MYLISICDQPKRGGPPAFGLGDGLGTPGRKNQFVTKCYTELRNCSVCLKRPRQWKIDIWLRIGTSGGLL
jgi:hypothetical protein